MADLGKVFEGPWLSNDKPHPIEQFKEAMRRSGIEPPETILMDGKLHRFPTKNGKDDAGYYVLYGDHIPAGSFGDWRSGVYQTFTTELDRPLTPNEKIESQWRMQEARARREEAQKIKHEQAAETVEIIWRQASPAGNEHPYLEKKRINVNGARVTGDGRLIVPLYNEQNELSSVQYISPDGEKKYHAGGAVKGCFNVIGDITQNEIIYIAEGFATAATAYETTGKPCISSFSASNLVNVAGIFREKYPESRIIVIADNDDSGVGRSYADQAASKYRCHVIMPPVKGDINDYKISGGNVKELLVETKSKLDWYWADQLPEEYIPPKEIIQGVLAEKSITVLYGDSNTGKTFFAVSVACAISEGDRVHDRQTRKGNVLYLASEAPETIEMRIQANRKYFKKDYKNIAVVKTALNFYESENDANEIIELITQLEKERGEFKLMIVDTLAQVSIGANENSGDMNTVISNVAKIKNATGVSALIIHHPGKDTSRGMRGHSSVRASIDTEIEVTEKDDIRTAKITKQRSLPSKGKELYYRLNIVEMGQTEWGDPATTCVVEYTDDKPETEDKKKTEKIKQYLEHFRQAWENTDMELDNEKNPILSRSALKRFLLDNEIKKETTVDKELTPSEKNRMIGTLLSMGYIEQKGTIYKVIDGDISSIMLIKKQAKTL